jgi:hypothetical protein
MSIMTDARVRLLEARVAEIERRLAAVGAPPPTIPGKMPPAPPTARREARATNTKPRKRSRKTP